jgi:uroporphyrinogen-III decarboxylase
MNEIQDLNFTSVEMDKINDYVKQIKANIEKEEMTPLERINLAQQYKEPDRIPVWLSSMEHNARAGGYTISEVLKDPKKAVLASLATLAKYGCDTITPYAEPHVIATEEIGLKVEYPEDGSPVFKDFPVKSQSDLDRVPIPDPYRDGDIPKVLQILKFMAETIGDLVPIWQNANGPFNYALELRGYTDLPKDMRTNPDFVHEVIKKGTEIDKVILKAIQEAGPNITAFPFDAMAAPGYIGVEGYKNFVWPYEKEAISSLKPPVHLGVDSDVTKILDIYTELGATGLMTERGTDQSQAKKIFSEKKVTLIAAEIVTDTLLSGTPEECEAIVKETIPICASGGGFVFCAGVVPIDVNPQNLLAIMEAARKYGKYGN